MALTLEQRIAATKSSSSGTGGGLTLDQRLAAANTRAKTKAPEKIFSGGTFSDVMDVLQVPQYAATGLLSGQGIVKGVTNRLTPSKAMNIKNPILGFAADVVLDPLMFLGSGLTKAGMKALAKGTGKTTLAAGVKAGEKALLTLDVPFVKSLQGITLIKGEKAAGALTKLGETIKRVPGLTDALKLAPPTGTYDLGKMEDIATGVRKSTIETKIAESAAKAKQAQSIQKTLNLMEEAKKAGVAEKEIPLLLRHAIEPGTVKVSENAAKFVEKSIRPVIDNFVAEHKALTGMQLQGKQLMNIIAPEFRKTTTASEFAKGVSKVAAKQGMENFAGYSKIGGLPSYGTPGGAASLISDNTFVKYGKNGGFLDTAAAQEARALKETLKVLRPSPDIPAKIFKKTKTKLLEKLKRIEEGVLERTAISSSELNDLLKAAGKPAIFDENIFNILATQGTELGKIRVRNDLAKTIKSWPEVKQIGKKGLVPDGYSRLKFKGLEDFALPKEMAKPINATYQKFSNIESINGFIEGYDKLQNSWKKLATYVNPSFHFRNFVSNQWQLYLADAFNPIQGAKDNFQLAKVRRAIAKGLTPSTVLKGKDLQHWVEFTDMGIGGSGQFFGDIATSLAPRNKVMQKFGSLGNFIEDGSKWTLYKARRNAGFSKEMANMEVRKFLFDYGDLSDFEKNVLKRVMPFYAWSRKNIPLQVAMLIQKPGKFSIIAKAKRAVENMSEGEPMDERLLPEWMSQGYNVWLGKNPEGLDGFFKMEGFVPAIDIGSLGRPVDKLTEGLTPMIKTPLEMIWNYDSYFKKQIEEFPGQTKSLYGVEVPAMLDKAVRSIRPVSEFEKLLGLSSSATQKGFTPGNRVQNYLMGQVSRQFDAKQEKMYNKLNTDKIQSKMKSELKKARKDGNTSKANNLMQQLIDLNRNRIK